MVDRIAGGVAVGQHDTVAPGHVRVVVVARPLQRPALDVAHLVVAVGAERARVGDAAAEVPAHATLPAPGRGIAQHEIEVDAAVEDRRIRDLGRGKRRRQGVRERPIGPQQRQRHPAAHGAGLPAQQDVEPVGAPVPGEDVVEIVVGIVRGVQGDDPVEGPHVALDRPVPPDVAVALDPDLELIGHGVRGAVAGEDPQVEPERKLLVAQGVEELRVPAGRHLEGDVAPGDEALDREAGGDLPDPRARVGPVGVGAQPELDEPGCGRAPARLRVRAQQPAVAAPAPEVGPARREEVVVRQALHARSELGAGPRGRPHVEIGPHLNLLDAALELRVREVREDQPGAEPADVRPQVPRPAAATGTGPTQTEGVVAPVPVDAQREVLGVEPREVEDVAAGVGGQRDAVPARGPALHDRLQVGQVVRELEGRLEDHVEVGASRRRAVAHVREAERPADPRGKPPTHRGPRREQRDGAVRGEVAVARIALDLEHGRDPPPVLGREAPGQELDPVDHVRVEDREEPAQMKGREDGHPVEQHQVLVLGAAAHVEGRREVRGRHHAREHLDRAHRVGLGDTRHRAHIDELQLPDGGAPDLLEADAVAGPLGLDRDALQLQRAPLQAHVEIDDRREPDDDLLRVLGVPERLDPHGVGAGRHVGDAERPQPVGVRGEERGLPAQQRHPRAVHGRALRVVDPTLDGARLGPRRSRAHRRQRERQGERRQRPSHQSPIRSSIRQSMPPSARAPPGRGLAPSTR